MLLNILVGSLCLYVRLPVLNYYILKYICRDDEVWACPKIEVWAHMEPPFIILLGVWWVLLVDRV